MSKKVTAATIPADAPGVSATKDAPRHLSKQEFGQRLKRKMIEKGLHHAELARRADLPRNNVSTYINGRSYPSETSLAKLAKALGVSADDLLPNRVELAIRGEQMPDMQIKASVSDPNRSWLQINRLVSTNCALAIAKLLQDDLNDPKGARQDD
jgi:transcriptional regulator with XRE-family HTH domain